MAKDHDVGTRNHTQADSTMPAITSSGSQTFLLQNASQNRYSLPVPIPERSASIPNETLSVSPVASTPPRLDALPDFALDCFQGSAAFHYGLEKVVSDINTKYGDSTNAFVTSSSPTNSIATRDRNTSRPRCMMPIYGDTPNHRPVIGELWTALNSQEESLQSAKKLKGGLKRHTDNASLFDDSHKIDTESDESENAGTPMVVKGMASDDSSTSASQLAGKESQENMLAAKPANGSGEIDPEKDNPHSNSSLSHVPDMYADRPKQSDISDVGVESSSHGFTGEDSLRTRNPGSTPTRTQSASRGQCPSANQGSTDNGHNLEDQPQSTEAKRGRNSSAPSVAALVSKFRRMEQSPEQVHPADDCAQEQDQVSVDSNSRFIQSYRQRSEDTDNENSFLSTVSGDKAGDGRPTLAVY
ncbi:hypothetical protein V2A60_009045 [Cordyceps javanica]